MYFNIGVFFGIRPLFLKHFDLSGRGVKTNVDALVGKTAIVSERIDPDTNKGRVIIEGENWRGQSADEAFIEVGEKVTVVRVEGTKLVVRPYSKREED